MTVAGDHARGRCLRAQRGAKPFLPRFGKAHFFEWFGACGQVVVCPASLLAAHHAPRSGSSTGGVAVRYQ